MLHKLYIQIDYTDNHFIQFEKGEQNLVLVGKLEAHNAKCTGQMYQIHFAVTTLRIIYK